MQLFGVPSILIIVQANVGIVFIVFIVFVPIRIVHVSFFYKKGENGRAGCALLQTMACTCFQMGDVDSTV